MVEADQGLTAKVIKLSNSAYFGFGHTVNSMSEAVSLLGVELLKALVLSAQLFDFCHDPGRAGISLDRLWARAQALGAAARAIAREERLPRELQEAAFTAGLLHNCGLLVLAANLPGPLSTAIDWARKLRQPLDTCERLTYRTTYPEVSAYVLGLWELPPAIVEAVAFHDVGPALDSSELSLPALLHVAHILVGENQPAIDGVPITSLKLPPDCLQAIEARLPVWQALIAELPRVKPELLSWLARSGATCWASDRSFTHCVRRCPRAGTHAKRPSGPAPRAALPSSRCRATSKHCLVHLGDSLTIICSSILRQLIAANSGVRVKCNRGVT